MSELDRGAAGRKVRFFTAILSPTITLQNRPCVRPAALMVVHGVAGGAGSMVPGSPEQSG